MEVNDESLLLWNEEDLIFYTCLYKYSNNKHEIYPIIISIKGYFIWIFHILNNNVVKEWHE